MTYIGCDVIACCVKVCIDFMYRCPIFGWVAVTWFKDRPFGYQYCLWPPGQHALCPFNFLYGCQYIFSGLWRGVITAVLQVLSWCTISQGKCWKLGNTCFRKDIDSIFRKNASRPLIWNLMMKKQILLRIWENRESLEIRKNNAGPWKSPNVVKIQGRSRIKTHIRSTHLQTQVQSDNFWHITGLSLQNTHLLYPRATKLLGGLLVSLCPSVHPTVPPTQSAL